MFCDRLIMIRLPDHGFVYFQHHAKKTSSYNSMNGTTASSKEMRVMGHSEHTKQNIHNK